MTENKIQQKCDAVIELLQDVIPSQIHAVPKSYAILTGGAIPSWLQGETPKDYDIFFTNINTLKKVMSRYAPILSKLLQYEVGIVEYIDTRALPAVRFNIQGLKVIPDNERIIEGTKVNHTNYYRVKSVSANAISFYNGIQIVTRFYGDAKQIHSTFDFEHLKNYYQDGHLHMDVATTLLAVDKKLVYTGSHYPIAAMFRTLKLQKRGYHISRNQLVKIMLDIAGLNLTNPEVLEDQLGGVYIAGANDMSLPSKPNWMNDAEYVINWLKSELHRRDKSL